MLVRFNSSIDFFDYAHGAVCPVNMVFVASSSPVEGWGRDSMVSELGLQQWASMGQEGCNDRGSIPLCPAEIKLQIQQKIV